MKEERRRAGGKGYYEKVADSLIREHEAHLWHEAARELDQLLQEHGNAGIERAIKDKLIHEEDLTEAEYLYWTEEMKEEF